MKGLAVFSFVIGILFSLAFIAANIDGNEAETANKDENFEFSSFTSAVCEDKNGAVYCKDELFVNCNGNISKAGDVMECKGISLDAPKVAGFAVFDRGWEDPRN